MRNADAPRTWEKKKKKPQKNKLKTFCVGYEKSVECPGCLVKSVTAM